MTNTTFASKRTNPRYLFSAEAEAMLGDGTSIAAQVFELSSRGCYIDTVRPLPIGMDFRLHISDGTNVCELPAKVIYVHQGYGMGVFGMGVVFDNIVPEQQLAIDTWLRELSREKADKGPEAQAPR